MVKDELYYSVSEPDYDVWDNDKYQVSTLTIFFVTPDDRKRMDNIFKEEEYGKKYVSDSCAIVVLRYQRDRTRDKEGSETMDPNKRIISSWYAEEIQHIPRCYSGIDVVKIETIGRLLRKMEKKSDEIYAKGLSITDGNDQYKRRVFLLKEIGAKELLYNRCEHRYYHRVGVYA